MLSFISTFGKKDGGALDGGKGGEGGGSLTSCFSFDKVK